jgi:predicted NAD/FAD-binding protein
MRIAVIGGGVSGLGAAWALRRAHEVTLFEANARLGGHANTMTIDYDGAEINVDTGFIVFNAHNYPNLVGLLDHFKIETIDSDMSFSVSDPSGYEWSSNGLSGLFAWKRNMASPAFLCMLGDIVRFSAAARADLAREERIAGCSIADYVADLKLGRGFLEHYLMPMGAAIWSTCEKEMLKYPALSFLRFFDNHRLLHAKRPKWRTIRGGSRLYVEAMSADLGARVRRAAPVVEVRREAGGVLVRTPGAPPELYDHAILACHSDEALAMLADADATERAALAAIRYAPNTAYLHRDEQLMPKRRAAWASWNYLRSQPPRAPGRGVCVSYWMNLLQDIDQSRPLFVTLNPDVPPRDHLAFAQIAYSHPQFDAGALAAQAKIRALQAANRVSFAGAWLGYGFHEDGLSSGIAAALSLGGQTPWATADSSAASANLLPAEAAAA